MSHDEQYVRISNRLFRMTLQLKLAEERLAKAALAHAVFGWWL